MNAYIFDFDGTLADSMPCWSEKMLNILQSQGVDYPPDIIKRIAPLGDLGTAKYFREELGVTLSFKQMQQMMDAFALPKYRDEIVLKPGVREYLQSSKAAGIRLYVLTASPHKMVDGCLKRNGVWELFDEVWTCEDFGMTKSQVPIYTEALKRIGIQASDAAFFDDNLTAIETAAKAGLYTVAVYDATGEDFAPQLKSAADRYIHAFTELHGTGQQTHKSVGEKINMSNEVFAHASWIWHSHNWTEDEHAEFCQKFFWDKGSVQLHISVRGDYTLFVNGQYAASNQYADFAHYKVYDTVDITPFLVQGENRVCIHAWYFGRSGMRYLTETPGLIYEILCGDTGIAASGVHTLSRKSRAYLSGGMKKISIQFGYSFEYDSAKEDNWLKADAEGFAPACVLDGKGSFYERPIAKLQLGRLQTGTVTQRGNTYLIDLGEEVVGLCSLSLLSQQPQKVIVAYGEVLEGGHVKRRIGERDFSITYHAKPGENLFTDYMLRMGCRYLELFCEAPIQLGPIGIIRQFYPVQELEPRLTDPLDRQIYQTCLNTLKLCMMEHYVDTPWREQCLYAFDSRNQMLAGYSAFADGNADYARANLLLIGQDRREDGLLSICTPSGEDLTIPSFSLYYILAVKEYTCFTGELTLAEAIFSKLQDLLQTFLRNSEAGLVRRFAGSSHWNFYDWSPHAAGKLHDNGDSTPDLLINAIMAIALDAFGVICGLLHRDNMFAGVADTIRCKARETYYEKEKGSYFVCCADEEPTELANSLAILSGIAEGQIARSIAEKLVSGTMIPCSLSMKAFKYDALLCVDREKHKAAVLDEIRSTYMVMLDAGSTTVWETIDGAQAFSNAGSLCHGWSAIPIHYYGMLM